MSDFVHICGRDKTIHDFLKKMIVVEEVFAKANRRGATDTHDIYFDFMTASDAKPSVFHGGGGQGTDSDASQKFGRFWNLSSENCAYFICTAAADSAKTGKMI